MPVEELLTELTPDNTSPLLPPDWTVPAELSTSVQGLPKIVCICGSTRFRDEMAEANRKLTLAGCIVVAPAVFQHRGDAITAKQKRALDELHLKKIDMADAIFVVDPGEYIGESTRHEIEYAQSAAKPIFRLSAIPGNYC